MQGARSTAPCSLVRVVVFWLTCSVATQKWLCVVYFDLLSCFWYFLLGHRLLLSIRGQCLSYPSAPTTFLQDLWPSDLQFSFIQQVPPAVGLLLHRVLGNVHLAGEAGDQTGKCCHRALRRCHKATTEAVEVWNRPSGSRGRLLGGSGVCAEA